MSESRIKFLLNVIHELYTIDDLSEIVNTIVEKTSKIFQAERVSLMLYSEEENKLRIAASKGISSSIVKKTEIKIGEQISGIALKEKKYFFVEDINSVIKDYNLKKKRNLKTSYIIVIPLLAGEKIVGTLNITEIKYPEKIKKRDRETLIDFSHHIGLAIERLKLLEFQKIKIQQAVTLFEISKTLNSYVEIEDTLESFIDILATLLGIAEIAIYIFHENSRTFKHKKSFNIETDIIDSINNDFLQNKDFYLKSENSYEKIKLNKKTFYYLPLKHEQKIIGKLIISRDYNVSSGENDHDMKFLSIVASQVAVILSKEILLDKLRIEKEKFRTLNHIGKELSSCFEVKKIEEILQENLHFLFDYEISVLVIFKPDFSGANMFFDVHTNDGYTLVKDSYDIMINFLRLNMSDLDETKITINGISPSIINKYNPESLKTHLVMPLIEKDVVMGAFFIGSSNHDDITINDDLELFSIIGNYIAVTLKKTQLFKENERLAFTDSMTETFNYRFFKKRFNEEFTRAARYKTPLTLLILDIDFFKYFNDNFGHQQGDAVLKEVALILKKSIRTIDIVARYGGEEFVIIYPETDIESAVVIAERIRKRIESFRFHNLSCVSKPLGITVSIGLACLTSEMKNMTELIDFADACLYRAKNNGRNRVCYYDGKTYKEEKNINS